MRLVYRPTLDCQAWTCVHQTIVILYSRHYCLYLSIREHRLYLSFREHRPAETFMEKSVWRPLSDTNCWRLVFISSASLLLNPITSRSVSVSVLCLVSLDVLHMFVYKRWSECLLTYSSTISSVLPKWDGWGREGTRRASKQRKRK